MVEIRPYKQNDCEGVRFVCLNSEGENKSSSRNKAFVLLTYCDYYIENEPQNCFVADDNGRVVGYVICTQSYDEFEKIFGKKYLPKVLKLGFFRFISSLLSAAPQNKYKENYPAHLHIDILPEYQRMGIGSRLIDALCDSLRQKGIKGVMLTAGAGNIKGVSFYTKYGFKIIEQKKGYVAFGLDFKN